MQTEANIPLLILVGGLATRMGGINKHQLPINGMTLLDNQLRILAPLFSKIYICGRREQYKERPAVQWIFDKEIGRGPAQALKRAFDITDADALFVLGGDMPFPSKELATYILSQSQENSIVPMAHGHPQVLFATYQRRDISNVKSLKQVANSGIAAIISEEKCKEFDPLLQFSKNWNEPKDAGELFPKTM